MQLKHVALVALIGMLCMQAWGATSTWQGTGIDDGWLTAGNWDAAPAAGDDIVFVVDPWVGPQASVTLGANRTVGQLTFTSTCPNGFAIGGANTLTVSGTMTAEAVVGGPNTYTFNNTGLVLAPDKNAPYAFDIGANVTVINNGYYNTAMTATGTCVTSKFGAGSVVFNGLMKSGTINVNAGSMTVNGATTITQGLVVDPSALFVVGGASTVTVGMASWTATMSGTVQLNNGAKLNLTGGVCNVASDLVASGATAISSNKASTFGGLITLSDNSTCALTTTAVQTLNGAITLNDNAVFTVASASIFNGTITLNDSASFLGNVSGSNESIRNAVTLYDNALFNMSGGTPTYGGSASFTLYGSSTAILRGAAASPLNGDIVADGYSTVKLASQNLTVNGDLTFSGTSYLDSTVGGIINGDITFNDDASARLTWNGNLNQTITLNDNAFVTISPANGRSYGTFVLNGNSLLVSDTNAYYRIQGITATDDSVFFLHSKAGTSITVVGTVSMSLRASGTYMGQGGSQQGRAIEMSGDTNLSIAGNAGGLIMRNTARAMLTNPPDTTANQMTFDGGGNTGEISLYDNAVLESSQYNPALGQSGTTYGHFRTASMTTRGSSTIDVYAWRLGPQAQPDWPFTSAQPTMDIASYDTSMIRIGFDHGVQVGNITSNDSSYLEIDGHGNGGPRLTGTINVNGTSQMFIGCANINSTIQSVAAGAHLTLLFGNVYSDINGISSSLLTLGGGGDPNSKLTPPDYGWNQSLRLVSTLDVNGTFGGTIAPVAWTVAYRDPCVYLDNVTGTGDLTKAGDAGTGLGFSSTINAPTSDWVGNVNVQTGWLQIRPDAAPAGLGTVNLATGTKLFLSSNDVTLTNTLVGKTISGLGTVDTGDYMVVPSGDGTGKIVSAGGTWKPGSSIGDLSVLGDLEFAMNGATAAQLVIEAAGGTSYDRLLVSSATTTRGNLTGLDNANLVLDIARSGWASYVSATLTIVTAANDLSAIAPLNSVTWNNNMVGQVNYTSGAITLTHVGLAGDGNNDGAIDATDYADWFNNYGTTPTAWAAGDFNGDGSVDATDYALWFNNYGAGTSGGPVPEPATMTLLVLGGLAMLRRRK